MRKMQYLVCIAFCVLFAACSGGRNAQKAQNDQMDDQPRILILTAFDAEAEALQSKLSAGKTYSVGGRTYLTGTIEGKAVVLVRSGISMVNAAAALQAGIDYFNITGVLFSGIAGGVNPSLNIGDVVIPQRWGQHLESYFARANGNGWDSGWEGVPYGNYGMIFPQDIGVPVGNEKGDKTQQKFWFEVDPDLLKAAESAAAKVQLDRCAAPALCLTHSPRVIPGGNGLSGSAFVDNAEYRAWLWENFQADAVDMESAAAAQVAYSNGMPFIAIRSLSDLAGGGPGENEMLIFFKLAAQNSAEFTSTFLQELP